MLVHLYFFIITCLISSVCTDRPCESWKNHKNFHLVHYEGDCGKEIWIRWKGDSISSRMLNGLKPAPGSLPWMAFVYIKSGGDEFKCGGSIINDRYVLTAGHCVNVPNINAIVVVGLYDKKDIIKYITGSENEYAYKVTSIVKHLDYQIDQYGNILNDIALLRVERKIPFESPYVNYICLPASCDIAKKSFLGEDLLMAGWGKTSTNTDSTALQKAELTVEKCEKFGSQPDDKSQLCTKTSTKKTCIGDSGGPLMHFSTTRVYQIGILSTGRGKCMPGELKESIFTKVSYYMTWILDNIKPHFGQRPNPPWTPVDEYLTIRQGQRYALSINLNTKYAASATPASRASSHDNN